MAKYCYQLMPRSSIVVAEVSTEVIALRNLFLVPQDDVGVPYGMGSCHTAEVGGYFIEGHVPVADIARLLEQRP